MNCFYSNSRNVKVYYEPDLVKAKRGLFSNESLTEGKNAKNMKSVDDTLGGAQDEK